MLARWTPGKLSIAVSTHAGEGPGSASAKSKEHPRVQFLLPMLGNYIRNRRSKGSCKKGGLLRTTSRETNERNEQSYIGVVGANPGPLRQGNPSFLDLEVYMRWMTS